MSFKDSQQDSSESKKLAKTIQAESSDRKSLVAKPIVDANTKMTIPSTKSQLTQTDFENYETSAEITNSDKNTVKYWKMKVQNIRTELHKALDEGDELEKSLQDLNEQCISHKQMLEEANSFIEEVKAQLGDKNNDTGICVNDISTNEESDGLAEENRIDQKS